MHIELHRTFRELAQSKGASSDNHLLHPGGDQLTWEDLLKERRVIVLSEAGSGKTQEIREAAKRLRQEGKAAFFLRLENVSLDFESSFEEGAIAEFQSWIASSDPGWLLLDSVDESRLKSPSDFERAIKKISSQLGPAKQRAYVYITGRAPAWRPVTDRDLCEDLLPYSAANAPDIAEAGSEKATDIQSVKPRPDANTRTFKMFSLDDLSAPQVKRFASGQGVVDTKAFLDAVERADAWSFTARPQDLQELTQFWNDKTQIGSRFELMQNSVERRLKERDQTRDEVRPLAPSRAREGARLIAAAATLMQQQNIDVPDGAHTSNGIRVETLLEDWTAPERLTLLTRPLFDEAIYGSVRFHHRSVREFLTAEWFAGLLKKDTSRRRVEQLFFRTQYGMEVVVPSLRPILPWLVMLDQKVLERVLRVAPEIVFEGGDPSQLPIHVRLEILEQSCVQLASGTSNRSMADFAAVQRFASVDLTAKVSELINRYEGDEDVQSFLLRMVWQGRLEGALPEALKVAVSASAPRHARFAAFRAIADLGPAASMSHVRQAFATEQTELDRGLLAQLVDHASPTHEVLVWLFDCLARVADTTKYKADLLDEQVAVLVGRVDESQLTFVVGRLHCFLSTPPFVEHRQSEISARYRWLLRSAGVAMQRVLASQATGPIGRCELFMLQMLPIAGQDDSSRIDHVLFELSKLVDERPTVKWTLFWHLVAEARSRLNSQKNERLVDWHRASLWPSCVVFRDDDFAQAVQNIAARSEIDDKLVALSLAFKLYADGGRESSRLQALKKVAASNDEIATRFRELLHPPKQPDEWLKYKKQESHRKRKTERERLLDVKNDATWRTYFVEKTSLLRDPGFDDPTEISQGQNRLFQRMRKAAGSSLTTWCDGNWQSLQAEFGLDVALAFRNGIVAYWRRYSPKLISEGAEFNSTSIETIFGLTGLNINAKETLDWTAQLTETEAEIAFRYAVRELNGFPPWFAALCADHTDLIRRLCMGEICHELSNGKVEPSRQYLLYNVAQSGDWLWDSLSPDLIAFLQAKEPLNEQHLRDMLRIIQGSNLPDSGLVELVRAKVADGGGSAHDSLWLAVWTGLSANDAIDRFEERLCGISNAVDQTDFAMRYATQLLGSRRVAGAGVRGSFNSPKYLKRLYLLMHSHVKRDEDLNRANTGVYSPGLRDNAQDAREHLLAMLEVIPGKESFLALQDLSRSPVMGAWREWLTLKVKSKAELDSETASWSTEQVKDFNAKFERTPSNHRELFDLAVSKLLDMKDDLESGDSSIASLLKTISSEIEIRKFIGKTLRDSSRGRYSIPQEEELADAKRPDFRLHGSGFDGPVPTELKLAGNCPGPVLFERLEAQLAGDYLRDVRSSCGIFLVVYRGNRSHWKLPNGGAKVDFEQLVLRLQDRGLHISNNSPGVDALEVIGIDLTKRSAAKSRKEQAAIGKPPSSSPTDEKHND